MRLVLQCAVCGTVHPVGASVCATCQAEGLQNLRLMFECVTCFRLGLAPRCEACQSAPPPFKVVPDPVDPNELARRWGVGETTAVDDAVVPLDPEDRGGMAIDDSGFDLLLDDDLPLIDPEDGPGRPARGE